MCYVGFMQMDLFHSFCLFCGCFEASFPLSHLSFLPEVHSQTPWSDGIFLQLLVVTGQRLLSSRTFLWSCFICARDQQHLGVILY